MDRLITSPEPAAEIALSWTSTGMAPSSGKVLRRLASLADEMSSADGGPISWSWLGRLALTIPNLPVPSRLLSQSERRLLKVYRLARTSGLFDAGWYVSQYPDAGADGVDPLRHFLERGAARGHLPSPLWRGLDTECVRRAGGAARQARPSVLAPYPHAARTGRRGLPGCRAVWCLVRSRRRSLLRPCPRPRRDLDRPS